MATQLKIEDIEPIAGEGDAVADAGGTKERDYEAEAKEMGWQSPGEFKGDPSKLIDAKTFVERGEVFMPLIKKERDQWKTKFKELERTTKQFAAFASKAEERAYERALSDLQARHDAAVEDGDLPGARKVMKELHELEKPAVVETDEKSTHDEAAERKKIGDWIDQTDWYGPDEQRTKYANDVADTLGKCVDYPGGTDAWLAEIERRVDRKFAEKKPGITNPGGNRNGGARGSKTWADLPTEAKQQADKFVKTIPGFTREKYVADYDWS